MKVFAVFGAALLAQGSAVDAADRSPADRSQERIDAAYEQIVDGEMRSAIRRLEAALAENPDDPALLINLGSAYLELGDAARATRHYEAAAASRIRYRLQLADGQWVDSRRAARIALLHLEERALASR